MQPLLIGITILFSLVSTTVMSYISMATPIGPWMEATLVLLATLLVKGLLNISQEKQIGLIGISAASGALGGIIATACAFSFPTLFFLDKDLFLQWLAHPGYFSIILGALVLVAGALAFLITYFLEQRFLEQEDMTFPVGTMVYKMIVAQSQMRKALELLAGALSAMCISVIQFLVRSIPNKIILFPAIQTSLLTVPQLSISLDTLPMLWAIGFVTGHVIAIPLLVGVISKIVIVDPAQLYFFPSITNSNFVLAFCSGMVVQGALLSFFDVPKSIARTIKQLFSRNTISTGATPERAPILMGVFVLIVMTGFLSFFKFSLTAQVYLLLGAFICTYQLLIIAGKAGIAPLGRFATFVMVPGLMVFGYTAVQVTLVATFVELCGGIAVDVMFGRKMAQLAKIPRSTIQQYQLLGLLVSACSIGVIFWALITHFGLGSTELFAQRAQSRALLINAYSFDWLVVALGILFSFALKYTNVNSVLVLGGLLMPFDYSLPLIFGGLSTYLVKDKEAQYPFWSGVFAASSIMMIVRALL